MNMAELEIRIMGVNVIRRRKLLERDPPVNWRSIIQDIRRCGRGTSEICFVLNINRGSLWFWECDGVTPGYEDGRALLKFHALVTGEKDEVAIG